MHLGKRICQHFANDWSAKTGRTSNMVKYYPSKSVAWTRNVHLLSSDLSEARSATSEKLDLYYEDCVIGGPGAFIMTIKDREKFQEAIRTKLVLEVAGLTPERRIVPAAEKEPRVPCLIGEKKWQERRGR